MAKLICTLRSTFPQVQPDIFKCSNCECEEVRPHWKFCCNCGEPLTEIFYPSDKKGGTDCMDEDAKQASIPYTYNAPQHDWKCGYPDITRDKGGAEE